MRKSLLLCCVASSYILSGCSAIDGFDKPTIAAKPTPSRLDEIAYINVLRSAFKQNTPTVNGEVIPLKTSEAISLNSKIQKQGAEVSTIKADIDIIKGTNGRQDESLTELAKDVKTLQEAGEGNEGQKDEEDPASPPNERVNLEKLQQSITANNTLCFDGSGLKRFKSKLGDGLDLSDGQEEFLKEKDDICVTYKAYQRPDFDDGFYNEENQRRLLEMQTYLAAGFGLTDLYCNRFFTTAAAATQNRQFAQDLNTGVDTLVGAVLSLSGAGNTALGITNSGFGLLGDGIQAFDAAYLVAPDLGAVRQLIEASQSEYRKTFFAGTAEQMKEYFPRSYPAARAVIERYASQCSFTGMRQLITKSVSDRAERIRRNLETERPARVMGNKDRNDDNDNTTPAAGATPTPPAPVGGTPDPAAPNTNAQPPSAVTETRILSVPIG